MEKQSIQVGDLEQVMQDALITEKSLLRLLHLLERIFGKGRKVSPQEGLVDNVQIVLDSRHTDFQCPGHITHIELMTGKLGQ